MVQHRIGRVDGNEITLITFVLVNLMQDVQSNLTNVSVSDSHMHWQLYGTNAFFYKIKWVTLSTTKYQVVISGIDN